MKRQKIQQVRELAKQPATAKITANEMDFLTKHKINPTLSFTSVWNMEEKTVNEIDRIMKKKYPNFIIANIKIKKCKTFKFN